MSDPFIRNFVLSLILFPGGYLVAIYGAAYRGGVGGYTIAAIGFLMGITGIAIPLVWAQP